MKILFHTLTGTLKDYPRADSAPMVGLEEGIEVLDLIEENPPEYNPQTHYLESWQILDLDQKRVVRGFDLLPVPPRVIGWPNVQAFTKVFTMPEKAALSLSQDATIAALRFDVSTWLGRVEVSDERVQLGLSRMVELGMISAARKAEIEAQAS